MMLFLLKTQTTTLLRTFFFFQGRAMIIWHNSQLFSDIWIVDLEKKMRNWQGRTKDEKTEAW